MGEEAPEFLTNCPDEFSLVVYDSEGQGCRTTTVLGKKIYVVEESNDGAKSSISVKIFDRSTDTWMVPRVLGMKPSPSKGHSALLLNKDRILLLMRDSSLDDCAWFLEVDTTFVKEQKKILGTEVVAWSKGVVGDAATPIVISGPSGVGKGTLISKLMTEFPSTFGFSVSHTTRVRREKEINGIHYNFTERSIMEKDIRDGKFLESASVHGNLYGTSIEAVEAVTDAGKRCVLDIDVQGARSVRASSLEAIFIFICPPSFEELEKRLRARGTETEEQIQKRLKNAKAELDDGRAAGLFDHILVNDDLELSYLNLKKILALDVSSDNASYGPTIKQVHACHSEINKDEIFLIRCGTDELKKTTPSSLFVLDVSKLKGGAPGWTRGLNIRPTIS